MKILCILACLVFLFSCSSESVDYFDAPFSYDVTFCDSELTSKGTLSFDGEKMVFAPHTPEGYKITVTKEGGMVEYNGLVFDENVIPSSRFLPLYHMLDDIHKGNTEEITFFDNPIMAEKDEIKLTVDKDIK